MTDYPTDGGELTRIIEKGLLLNNFQESQRALQAAKTVTVNPAEILGTARLEALCKAIEQLGWGISRRDDVEGRCFIGFEVGKTRYGLFWMRADGDKFILGSDYAVPEGADELSLRRRASYVQRRVWFAKAGVTVDDKPTVSFTYEGRIPATGVEDALEEARRSVDAGAAMYFGKDNID